MADIFTDQMYHNVTIEIFEEDGTTPAQVEGAPVWASSDETVLTIVAATDGMMADVIPGAPGTARFTITADADLGSGVTTITAVSEDIVVTERPGTASIIRITLPPPVPKV